MSATGGPGPSTDPDEIRRAREQRRDLFSQAQVRNPWTFVSTDNPLQTLAPPQIDMAMKRLGEIAGAEGSAIVGTDWESEIDSSASLSENIDHLLDIGGRLPIGERDQESKAALEEEDVDEIERQRARDEILEVCEALDDAGIDGAAVLEFVAAEQGDRAADRLEGTGFSEDEIETLLDSIADELGRPFVIEAIEECRDRLGGPGFETAGTEDLIEELRERFDLGMAPPEAIIEDLQQRIEEAEEAVEEERELTQSEIEDVAINRLERGFGMRFDSLDDAIRRLQERIERARGQRLRIAPIIARRSGDDVLIRIDDGDDFQPFREPVNKRARRELDLSNVTTTWTEIGDVRLRGEDLEEIDLSEGREKLGAVEEPQPLEIERGPTEQQELEAVTAETIVDRIIDGAEQEGFL